MSMPTERVYSEGSEFPALTDGLMRVYSMRLCPYAQRTRLVLKHKDIQHEIVNIHLGSKPAWFKERNPKGQVPVIEHNGKVVNESRDCNEYLEQKYPQKSLIPKDAATREHHKQLTDRYDKEVIPRFYKLIRSSGGDKENIRKELYDALDAFENEFKATYFGGESPSMIDYNLWPWLERLAAIGGNTEGEFPPPERFPRLRAFIAAMHTQSAVVATRTSAQIHDSFVKSYLAGKADYDMGL